MDTNGISVGGVENSVISSTVIVVGQSEISDLVLAEPTTATLGLILPYGAKIVNPYGIDVCGKNYPIWSILIAESNEKIRKKNRDSIENSFHEELVDNYFKLLEAGGGVSYIAGDYATGGNVMEHPAEHVPPHLATLWRNPDYRGMQAGENMLRFLLGLYKKINLRSKTDREPVNKMYQKLVEGGLLEMRESVQGIDGHLYNHYFASHTPMEAEISSAFMSREPSKLKSQP